MPTKKPLPKKRNLAAKALREPLFRPKVMAHPNAYKRKPKFNQKADDEPSDDQIS